jgi:hypothetical protein
MKDKLIVLFFCFISLAFSEPYQNAFNLNMGLGFGKSTYFPVYSLSIAWLNDNRFKDINAEFGFGEISNSRSYYVFGVSYSYLVSAIVNNLYIGPSIAISLIWDSEHNESFDNHPDDFNGNYFLGIKGIYLFGTSNFKISIANRLLTGFQDKGVSNSSYKIALFNLLSIGILVVF